MLHENEANQLITCRFSKFLIQLCKKKRFLWGFVLKYYFLGGSCRNITVPRYWASEVLCRALFRGCAEILVLGRNIHLWYDVWFQLTTNHSLKETRLSWHLYSDSNPMWLLHRPVLGVFLLVRSGTIGTSIMEASCSTSAKSAHYICIVHCDLLNSHFDLLRPYLDQSPEGVSLLFGIGTSIQIWCLLLFIGMSCEKCTI